MLLKGEVEHVDQPGPGYYSQLFLVKKVMGGLEAHHLLICIEELRHTDEVPGGNGHVCSRVDLPGGLDVLHRPEGRILSDSDPSGVLPVSLLLSQETCVSVLGVVLQPIHSSAGVHQSLRSGFGVGASEGHASPPLLGRLAGRCRVEGSSAATSGLTSPVVR